MTRCWASFHVFIYQVYIFGEVSVQIFCSWFKQVVYCWVLRFFFFWCILDNSPLLDMSFTNIFPPVCGCLFYLCRAKVFNFNDIQLINYFFHVSPNPSRFSPMLSSRSFIVFHIKDFCKEYMVYSFFCMWMHVDVHLVIGFH